MTPQKNDVGVIGLAAMGANLAMNIADHGFRVAVFNRSPERTEALLSTYGSGKGIDPAYTLEALVRSLSSPRTIILMIQAGEAVDQMLEKLATVLESGDIVIDGGNSHYRDTARRVDDMASRGIRFVGMGISGGEEGARNGPSLMPGVEAGTKEWSVLEPMLSSIAARDFEGNPCVAPIGSGAAGHFVKMVHNGIEYADMQLIAEAYWMMKRSLGMDNDRIADVFDTWNSGRLESYLVGITGDILRTREADGGYVIDRILDCAGSKGTGRWTAEEALALGAPAVSIAEAVFARYASTDVAGRHTLSKLREPSDTPLDMTVEDIERSLYAAKLISYAQGLQILSAAAEAHGWPLRIDEIARLWQGGCIIRARFLRDVSAAYAGESAGMNLLQAPFSRDVISRDIPSLRTVVSAAAVGGVPAPGFFSALSYFDSVTAPRLPANLIQAQRDYFGAHTFVRTEGGTPEHFDWTRDEATH